MVAKEHFGTVVSRTPAKWLTQVGDVLRSRKKRKPSMMEKYRPKDGELSIRVLMAMTETNLGVVASVGDEATDWISTKIERAGLRVYRSFDLRSARAVTGTCTCPYHGTEACDCQMVVLLVYQEGSTPATVVLHGHQGRTWILLEESPNEEVRSAIAAALGPARTDDDSVMSARDGWHGHGQAA